MDPLSKANGVQNSAEDFFSFKSASEAEILVIVGCLETSTWPEFGWLKTSMTRIELSRNVNMTKIWLSRNVNMTRIWMFTEVNMTKIWMFTDVNMTKITVTSQIVVMLTSANIQILVILPHSALSWILSLAENLASSNLQYGATKWHYNRKEPSST